jgi:hypothetical protein
MSFPPDLIANAYRHLRIHPLTIGLFDYEKTMREEKTFHSEQL